MSKITFALSKPNNFVTNPIDKITRLHKAIRNGHIKAATRLITEEGSDIEELSCYGAAALYIAIKSKQMKMAELLIQHKANVNAKTAFNNDTPLNVAMGYIDIKFAKLLIDNGADIEEKTPSGDSPLNLATRNYNIPLIQLLLIKGVDVESTSPEGLTSLSMAIKVMNFEMIRMFIWYGANITSQNLLDAIVEGSDKWEVEILNMLKLSLTLDLALSSQICDLQKIIIESFNFNSMTQAGSDILFNRVFNKYFRKKELSLNELNNTIETLLNSLDKLDNIMPHIDLFQRLKGTLNELGDKITGSALYNEVGEVSSLFKLSVNALKKEGLWNEEETNKSFPDISDKANSLQEVEDFFKKMYLTLKFETSTGKDYCDHTQEIIGNLMEI